MTGLSAMSALGWLMVIHALTDFPLQGDFLARAKNHRAPVAGVPWRVALAMHCLIVAGGVALILPWPYAVIEFFFHWITDWTKNEGQFGEGEKGFLVDQLWHVFARLVYWYFGIVR